MSMFSVLMANYNDGRYISNAIESVFAQSYKDWEIIIVDDCSTDDSVAILKKYSEDERLHIYRNDTNHGCGYTKRRCVELAHGEICGFLDADDALTPDALEIMCKAHAENHEASLIYSRCYRCDEQLNIEEISQYQCQIPQGSSFLEYKRGAISHFATFKKAAYDKTVGINSFALCAEDHDLYLKLEEVGSTLFIDRPLYYYRRGTGNNVSLDQKNNYAVYWDAFVMCEACARRKLNAESLVFPMYDQLINILAHSIIESSKDYRLGHIILAPIRFVKRILHG